jgi:hypothetical protein
MTIAGNGFSLFATFFEAVFLCKQSQRKQTFRDYSLRNVVPATPAIQDQTAAKKQVKEHYCWGVEYF